MQARRSEKSREMNRGVGGAEGLNQSRYFPPSVRKYKKGEHLDTPAEAELYLREMRKYDPVSRWVDDFVMVCRVLL